MSAIILSKRQQKLLLNEIIMLDEELNTIISDAKPHKQGVVFDMTSDQLDELLGYVAAEANHARSKYMEKQLDELYNVLESFEK